MQYQFITANLVQRVQTALFSLIVVVLQYAIMSQNALGVSAK